MTHPIILGGLGAASAAGPIRVENADGTTTVITSLAEAGEVFGVGSAPWGWARRHFEGTSRAAHACAFCRTPISSRDGSLCGECSARNHRFLDLESAFYIVARCVELVDAHARALLEVDGSAAFGLEEWRELAFHHLALLFARSPELLPFIADDGELT